MTSFHLVRKFQEETQKTRAKIEIMTTKSLVKIINIITKDTERSNKKEETNWG